MPPGRSFSSRAAASRAPNAEADPSKPTTAYTRDSGGPARVLRREGEQPGRRGSVLALTPRGEQHLKAAAQAVRHRLAERLTGWDDGDIATFAQLVTRFNLSRG